MSYYSENLKQLPADTLDKTVSILGARVIKTLPLIVLAFLLTSCGGQDESQDQKNVNEYIEAMSGTLNVACNDFSPGWQITNACRMLDNMPTVEVNREIPGARVLCTRHKPTVQFNPKLVTPGSIRHETAHSLSCTTELKQEYEYNGTDFDLVSRGTYLYVRLNEDIVFGGRRYLKGEGIELTGLEEVLATLLELRFDHKQDIAIDDLPITHRYYWETKALLDLLEKYDIKDYYGNPYDIDKLTDLMQVAFLVDGNGMGVFMANLFGINDQFMSDLIQILIQAEDTKNDIQYQIIAP